MPDVDLLLWNKVKSGDDASYEILFRRYYPGLCLFAQRYTNDMFTAREVVQDLFIDLWEFRNDLSVTRSFKSYLFTAVKFNSIRRMQNDKKLWTPMDILPEPENAQFADMLELAELEAKIMDAIESLPEQCRKIFKMSRFEQLKYAEIASQLQLSVKTIEAQMSKALKLIQNAFENEFIVACVLLLNIFF
jgi:RNA polymerase sigma-70 factor, Bacteroides expansion family 1